MSSESINELATALSKAKSSIKPPVKNRFVDFLDKNGRRVKYSYADLADVISSYQEELSKNGLAITQSIDSINGIALVTSLIHSSGEWISSRYPLPDPTTMKPQEFGSFLTYARRYSSSMLIDLASEDDDDGNVAQGKGPSPQPTPHREPEKPLKNYAPGADEEVGFKGLEESKRSEPFDSRLETKIEFGKYVGKTLKDVGQSAAVSYVKWLKDSAKAQNKDMNDRVKGFCELVESVWGKCD